MQCGILFEVKPTWYNKCSVKKMKLICKLIFVILIFLLTNCGTEPKSVGNSLTGYNTVAEAKIQPKEAVELAMSYLDKTFELRQKNRESNKKRNSEPIIYVTLKNNEYYIVKENYPDISVYFYLKHAVRVNINTGHVTPPE
jgi:hypothetical protein